MPARVLLAAAGMLAVIATLPLTALAQGSVTTSAAAPAATAAAEQDLAFGRFIALIRAHLATGDELMAQRQWQVAAQHYGFPREEIYGIIRGELRVYHTPGFDDALKALARAANLREAKAVSKARQKIDAALAAADAGLKARQPDWPRFTLAVAIAVLNSAPDEFDDAVSKAPNAGRVVHPLGYQTARGFVREADRMIESVAGGLDTADAGALADMRAGLSALKANFVPVVAPRQTNLTDAAFQSDVAQIVAAVRKVAVAQPVPNLN